MAPEVLVEVTTNGDPSIPPLVRLALNVIDTVLVAVVAKVATSPAARLMERIPPEKLTLAGLVLSSMDSSRSWRFLDFLWNGSAFD